VRTVQRWVRRLVEASERTAEMPSAITEDELDAVLLDPLRATIFRQTDPQSRDAASR
jgi:hypothetical protein